MKQIVIVNQSADQAITNDVLLQIAAALALQNVDFAKVWDGVKGPDGIPIDAKATFSVAQQDAGIPSDAAPLLIQDTSDAGPGVLGYHDRSGNVSYININWPAIKQNGGTLLTGPNSLSATCGHEVPELLADWDASGWVAMADPTKQTAFEVCDGCEGYSSDYNVPAVGALPAGPVAMSDWLMPAWFVLGSQGPWDFLKLIPGPQTMGQGAYEIVKSIATGDVTDNFACKVEDGGTPAWRREVIAAKHERPGSRHHKRSHATARPAAGPSPDA